MRYRHGIFLLIVAGAWLTFFASGVSNNTVQDRIINSRELPPTTVISPYARVNGRLDGDFTRRADALTPWFHVRWVERQHADETLGGPGHPEQAIVQPRWDRVFSVALAIVAPGVLILWLTYRNRKRPSSQPAPLTSSSSSSQSHTPTA